nr:hypothetical protein [Tanacetum cinerariifolium]
ARGGGIDRKLLSWLSGQWANCQMPPKRRLENVIVRSMDVSLLLLTGYPCNAAAGTL